jgi:2'-5' RNA ligase
VTGGTVRSFVAVLLPDAVRARLAEAAADLRERAPGWSWVRPENLHLTLRFLGGLETPAVAAAQEAVLAAAAGATPFGLRLGGLGGFPSPRTPRVVWAGVVAGAEPLGRLQAAVERELAVRGIPPEARAFHGHVTLARARDPRGGRSLAAALGGAAAFGGFTVEQLHLMRSELDPRGARYSVLAEAALGSARDG